MDQLTGKIENWLADHRAELLEDLQTLMSFESLDENTAARQAALRFVLSRAREMGMRTGHTAEYDAGWAEIGSGSVTLGILAHVDVVAVGDRANWATPPFALTERDGWYCGRGIEDDKGPVIMSLYGLRALRDLGVPLGKRLRLIVGTSEETVWNDMAHYKRDFGMPDYSFSPDGGFPVFNIEKGYCDIVLRFSGPDLARLAAAEAGESPNSVPSSARYQLRGGEAQVFPGKAVHSSVPWLGDDPILKLGVRARDDGFAFGRFLCERFGGDFHGVRLGLDDGSDTCDGVFVGQTACAPTVLRFENGCVSINLNIRYRAGLTRADIERAFGALAAEYGYQAEIIECTPPMLVDPNQPFLQDMNTLLEKYGLPTGFQVAAGASYSSTMRNCVSWGPVISDELSTAHMDNERLAVADFWKVMQLYIEYFVMEAEKSE